MEARVAAPELPAAMAEHEQSNSQRLKAAQPNPSQQQVTVMIPPARSVQPTGGLCMGSQVSSHGTNLPPPLPLVTNGPSRLFKAAPALQQAQPEQQPLPSFSLSSVPNSTQSTIAASQGSLSQPAATAAQPRQSVGVLPPLKKALSASGAMSSAPQAHIFRPPLPMPASLALGVKRKLTKKMASILKNFPPNKKKTRAKKPKDAPKRPKSAYMFFLGEFREEYKKSHPEVVKVAAMAEACGAAWRALSPDRRAVYDALSAKSKAEYATLIEEYEKEHPKPLRGVKLRDPDEIRRPQSAYFCFLADFREKYKMKHVGEAIQVKVIGAEAGKAWKQLSEEEKQPWEAQSRAMKDEFKSRTAEAAAVATQATAAEMLAEENNNQETWPDDDMPENMQTGDDDQGQEWFRDPAAAPEEVRDGGQISEELQNTAQARSQRQQGSPPIEEFASGVPEQPLTSEITSTTTLLTSSAAVDPGAEHLGLAAYQFRELEHTRHLSPTNGPLIAPGAGACESSVAHGLLGGSPAQPISSYCHNTAHLSQGEASLPASTLDRQARLDFAALATTRSQAGEDIRARIESGSELPAPQLDLQYPYNMGSSMTALPPDGSHGGYQGEVPLLGVSGQPMPPNCGPTQPGSANSLMYRQLSAQRAMPRHFPSVLSHADRDYISSPFSSSHPVVTLPGGACNEHHRRPGNTQLPALPSLPSLGGLPSLPMGGWSQSVQDQ